MAASVSLASVAAAQTAPTPPAPESTPTETPTYVPGAAPSAVPAPGGVTVPGNGTATRRPFVVSPEAGQVAVGATQQLTVGSVLGTIVVTVHDPAILDASVDQNSRIVTLSGKAPGTTTITITDSRGVSRDVPVSVAITPAKSGPTSPCW